MQYALRGTKIIINLSIEILLGYLQIDFEKYTMIY